MQWCAADFGTSRMIDTDALWRPGNGHHSGFFRTAFLPGAGLRNA